MLILRAAKTPLRVVSVPKPEGCSAVCVICHLPNNEERWRIIPSFKTFHRDARS